MPNAAPGAGSKGQEARDKVPWGFLVSGVVLILAVVYGAFEVVFRYYAADADALTAWRLGLPRAILAVTLVSSFIVAVLVRHLRFAEQRMRAALAAESRFRVLLEANPHPVVLVDPKGRVVLVNRQAERSFGRPRAVLLGGHLDQLVPDLHIPDPASLPGGDALHLWTEELEGRRADGKTFPVEIILTPVETAEGLLVAVRLRDLTESKRIEEERLRSIERLQELERLKELDKFKTQFINMAAHELNTPLTPIKLQIDLLKSTRGGHLDEDQRKGLAILDRNVERLVTLVGDVLEVARLQAGRLGIERHQVDLNRLVLEAAESFQEQARKQGIQLETRLAPDLVVEADPKRITQVLFNLMSNALKFTNIGGKVWVETRREASGAIVAVRDTGLGLAAKDLPRLFQPFSQVHDPGQRSRPGTGLGLYISRGIVELHGGRIWAESEGPGKGSSFSFALPREARAPIPPQETAAEDDAVARRARELV